jgi:ribosomal protein S25
MNPKLTTEQKDEIGRTFHNRTYPEMSKAYNVSSRTIEKYVSRYMNNKRKLGTMRKGVSNNLIDRVESYIKANPYVTIHELQNVFKLSESKAITLYMDLTKQQVLTPIFGHKNVAYYTEDEMLKEREYKAEDLIGWELTAYHDISPLNTICL